MFFSKTSFKTAGQIVTYWHLGAVIALVFRYSHNLAVRLQKNCLKFQHQSNQIKLVFWVKIIM